MKLLYLFFPCVIAIACKRGEEKNPFATKYNVSSHKDIHYFKLELDSIRLDPISCSFVGESCIHNQYIYFIDQKFSYVYKFSLTGKYINKYIGQGGGKDELPIKTIHLFSPLPDGGFFFIGPSWDCFEFDSNFIRRNDYGINWHPRVSKAAMLKKPDPSETQLYSLMFNTPKIRARDKSLYLPIASQHPTFNPTNPMYFREARNLALMDLESGYIEKMLGRFSPVYSANTDISTFCFQFLALTPGNTFQIAFPPDPLIYKLNDHFQVTDAFGVPGRDMDTSYHSAKDLNSFRNNLLHELKERGYYTGVEYIPERDFTFRSYQKNGKAETDGLQIYKGDTLIGDIDVPKGFKVEGYSHPYFYSKAFINEEDEQIKLYKFKLP